MQTRSLAAGMRNGAMQMELRPNAAHTDAEMGCTESKESVAARKETLRLEAEAQEEVKALCGKRWKTTMSLDKARSKGHGDISKSAYYCKGKLYNAECQRVSNLTLIGIKEMKRKF